MNSVELAIDKTTACAIFILDPHKEGFPITYCNLEFERLSGYTRDEIIGHPLEQSHLSQSGGMELEKLRSALNQGQETTVVINAVTKQGAGYRSRLTVSPVNDSSGRLSLILGIQIALPKDSETQRALNQAQLFLESAPDATFIVDASGNLILTNREAEFLFGYTSQELVSMPIEALMPARYRNQHLAHRKHFTVNPTVREMGAGMSIIALTKSGAEIPVDIRLSPIQSEGKQYFSASVRDISTRVNAEQALEDARDIAERATAEKSRFLAAASHDLRQPLQAISLYLSVLGRTEDCAKRQEISTKMQLSLDNINNMLGALLDVSKLDSGAIQPEKSNVRVQTILDKIVAGSAQQANEKGLLFNCTTTPIVVFTDPALLERVIENFVTNAIRYTETGSVSINCNLVGQQLSIEVQDTGIGIDHDQLDQVFEEYYQLDNPMRNRHKGLGLGLSIVKHIAKLLGHTVDVQSEVGKGSTFSISVPVVQSDAAKERTSDCDLDESLLSDIKPLVLLVDDDPDVLDSTTMLLNMVGIEVVSGADGNEALKHLDTGLQPAMIISDFRLPGMNGVEFLQAARTRLHTQVPAIIMTGDTGMQEIEDKKIELCHVVYKPVDTNHILELIRETIKTNPG